MATYTQCHEWPHSRASNGYGAAYKDGRYISAHRLAYENAYGPIPEGLCVLHRCDNRPCVNPEHLFLGTHKDNAHDREMKGRGGGWMNRGEGHGLHKLTEPQVIEIRRRAMEGETQRALGSEFGVSHQTVSLIVRGLTWGGVALSPRIPSRR